jgi:hypothetical protein
MRRVLALAIDEATFGPDHPIVAIRLNKLALFLRATNRLTEAEPLMRLVLAILVDFRRKTRHPYPHRDTALRNYAGLLAAIGKSEARSKPRSPARSARAAPETLLSSTVFSDLFVVPAKATRTRGPSRRSLKSAALDAPPPRAKR